jgi:hypothetical protein
MDKKIYSVTERLPNNNSEVMCYGHLTFCCKLDMEEVARWHKATFTIATSSYRLKKEVPKDPEESIFEICNVIELWIVKSEDNDDHGFRVLGVSKWHYLEDE